MYVVRLYLLYSVLRLSLGYDLTWYAFIYYLTFILIRRLQIWPFFLFHPHSLAGPW